MKKIKKSVVKEQRNVDTVTGVVNDAASRLEKASKLLDDGKVSILEFLKMLNSNGKWFTKNLNFSFEFKEENTKNETFFLKGENYIRTFSTSSKINILRT